MRAAPGRDPVLAHGRRSLPFALVGLLVGLAVGAGVLLTSPSLARATTVVELTAIRSQIDLTGAPTAAVTADTDAQLLASDEVVAAAAAAAGRTPEQARGALSVSAVALTRVLSISYEDRSAKAAEAGSRAAAAAFLAARERLVLDPVRAALASLGQVVDAPAPVAEGAAAAAPVVSPLGRQQAALAAELALNGAGTVLVEATTAPRQRANPEVPLGSGAATGALLGLGLGLLLSSGRPARPVAAGPAHRSGRRTAALGIALGLVGTAAGLAAASQVGTGPSATATVLVRPLVGNAYAGGDRDASVDLQTEAQVVRSDAVLSRAVPNGSTVTGLRARVRAERRPGSEVLAITVGGSTGDRATALAGDLARALLAEREERARQAVAAQAALLRERITQAQQLFDAAIALAAGAESVQGSLLGERLVLLREDLRALPTELRAGSVVEVQRVDTSAAVVLQVVLVVGGGLAGLVLGLLLGRRPRQGRPARGAGTTAAAQPVAAAS